MFAETPLADCMKDIPVGSLSNSKDGWLRYGITLWITLFKQRMRRSPIQAKAAQRLTVLSVKL